MTQTETHSSPYHLPLLDSSPPDAAGQLTRTIGARTGSVPATVRVEPAGALAARGELFAALEIAYEVRFKSDAACDPAALIRFSDGEATQATHHGLPTLVFADGRTESVAAAAVEVAPTARVDRALRGRAIIDGSAGRARGLEPVDGEEVLAVCDQRALWTVTHDALDHRVAVAPQNLGPDETLCDALRPGRWLALAALVHWLRTTGLDRWEGPAPRACVLFDDPNVRTRTYGFINFEQLARDAALRGYHIALATIPLDGWYVHPAVARLLQQKPPKLSLAVHGNDHHPEEMRRVDSREQAAAVLAQSLQRIARLERRAGAKVDRVITAPHGRWSDAALLAVAGAGFDAAANYYNISPRRVVDPAVRSLTAWGPATIAAGKTPMIAFWLFNEPLDGLALRAFLRQPLILYGHHDDLADGLDVLRHAVDHVDGLGDVRWGSLGEAAAANVQTCRDGELLRVRPWSRRTLVDVPVGVQRLRVDLAPGSQAEGERILVDGRAVDGLEFEVAGPGRLELRLTVNMSPAVPAKPVWRPWPYVRRAVTEGRDRLQPLARRATRPTRDERRAA